jgi:acetyltransferase-like isoleucine patch superfamily enzyme
LCHFGKKGENLSFLNHGQLKNIGFKDVGKDVLVSDRASIYNPGNISIGDRSRIDDFCILSAGLGGIKIGRNVHIACHVTLIGSGAIVLEDYVGLSGRVSLYSSSDDFSGEFMTNPTIPDKFTSVRSRPVTIGRHAIIGTGVVILPGVNIGEGASVAALSLVLSDCRPFMSYRGNPALMQNERRRDHLTLSAEYEKMLARESTDN